MADDFQPISYRSISGSDNPQASARPTKNDSQASTQADSRQNDFIATEIRRMQRAREEENNALRQLLSRQPQMAVATESSSNQFNSNMNNSSSSSFGPSLSTQMNNFMPQALMNNLDRSNLGLDGLNSMNNSMKMNTTNNALGSQLNNFMPSSFMNNSMNMNGMDSIGMNHQMNMNMNNFSSASGNSSSSQFNNIDLPSFDSSMNNFMSQAIANNHQNGTNMESLGGMNDYIKNNNQLMTSTINNSFMPSAAVTVTQQPPPHEDPGWEEQYKALRDYHLRFGNCKVPARFKANPKLGRWVMTQRRQFTLLMQGFPSALTAERIRRLESLGFTWSVRPEPVSTWNKKFQELKAYKATYGNCMVPQRYQANSQLGTWVHTQRRQYKLMSEGKKSSMTKEKADALDSIGFFWAAKHSISSSSDGRDLPSENSLSDSSEHDQGTNAKAS